MNPVEFVREHAPFDLLPEEALALVQRGLEITFYPGGSKVLERSGSKSQHLYLIRKGGARLERDGQAILHLEEGEVFGYPSLLSQDAPAFDVVAEEDLLVYRWPREVFQKLMEYPAFAEFFTRGLAERLRISSRVEGLGVVNLDLALPVGELISRPPVLVPRASTVGEAARVMQTHQISSVLVEGEPLGILTDRDLRNRVLAAGKGPDTPVAEIMSAPVKTLPASTPLFEALSYMVRQGIHHLPLEQDGQIIGLITDTVLMRQQAKSPLYLLRRLERTRNPGDLTGYGKELTGVAESLLLGGLGASEIGRSVSSLNDQLVRTLLRLGEERLGAPPTPYAWIVFGSEGRMEQALLTDQDNALIYQEETPATAAYFEQLAAFVVEGLIQAGFPPCPGGYMATHWRKSLPEWEQLFRHWLETPKPQELLEAQIFFDFRAVYGELSLEPLERIVAGGADQGIFLAQLARASLQFRPPIGFFRQIREEDGGVDLKKGGIAPIVSLARVYALEARSLAKGTVERLQAAAREHKLSPEGAETLVEAFGFLMRLRLREQLASLRRGEPPGNKVPLENLSPLERRHLKEAFLQVREMQEAMSQRFHTDRLG
ncbi:MAG: putative nucleotidyltransferase substrate binding domain-containing protein [Meiothermus sp.]|uniref:putative nucleotidyltransferase substrate binding domain-containing protein n=1 Tax=Meiothermus sp. TaxID=1955249 RepID=UPI00298ED405|nr:putative nucleotidyltransferase substrate binding domain-containing protein [Meiothermus sp.]MDW8424935.1 putative nucleotidyltransferase substrate binding domain-containing protein [Meiothermus sp.]